MTRFVQLCASEEGFGLRGTIPTLRHNPMDLRHSPHSEHPGDPNAVGQIDTDADGYADAERQAELWAGRGLTLRQAIYEEAPPGIPDNNNTERYLAFVAGGLGVPDSTPMRQVLLIPAV